MYVCNNCGNTWPEDADSGNNCSSCWTGKGVKVNPADRYFGPGEIPEHKIKLRELERTVKKHAALIRSLIERAGAENAEIKNIKNNVQALLKGSLRRAEFIAQLMGNDWRREEFLSDKEEEVIFNPAKEIDLFNEEKPDHIAELKGEGRGPAKIDSRYLCSVFLMGMFEGERIIESREARVMAAREIPYLPDAETYAGFRAFRTQYLPEIMKDLFSEKK